ncbi:energy-coupling factor ABC transporter permease [bacterium]|nr:energy-coupling factor ABC transporter permease [FCB group bacterium]MBL7190226.1 energy-coupling factor ABC transporter permease [bacterium]
MHIPDGFLSGGINAAGFAVSAGVISLALAKAKKKLEDRYIPLIGVTAAFIFAAQMVNFPVAGGTSGHFLGAALAAMLLGPLTGCLIISIVLIVQCLGFADGGITALGTNIFNMGVIGCFSGYYIFTGLRKLLPKNPAVNITAVSISAWMSVVLASVFCSLELAFSGITPLKLVLPAMAGIHAIIGVGEAFITAAVVSLVMKYRPDVMDFNRSYSNTGLISGVKL